jgi:hypothetical protein
VWFVECCPTLASKHISSPVMGFFGLSSSEYAERISAYIDGLLREEEISRMQQVYGAKLRIGAGVGFAVHSGGLSLVSAAVSGRSLDVAKRKLEMIQDELRRRDIPLYESRKRAAFVGFVKNLPRMALDGGTGASQCVAPG